MINASSTRYGVAYIFSKVLMPSRVRSESCSFTCRADASTATIILAASRIDL